MRGLLRSTLPFVARRLRASIASLERQLPKLSPAARGMCSVSIVRLEEKLREVELRRCRPLDARAPAR